MEYTELVEKQGWDDDTMRHFLEEFIRTQGVWTMYVAFLNEKAKEENAEVEEPEE